MAAPQDSLFTMIWIFGFGVVAVLAVMFFSFLTPILVDAFAPSDVAVTTFTEFNSFLPSFFSWVFGIVFVSLPLIGLGLAFLVAIDNFWWWVYAALGVLVLGIGWMFQSLWGWFVAVDMIGDAASQVFILDLVFGNYGFYSVLVLFVIGLGTYVKQRRGSALPTGGFR